MGFAKLFQSKSNHKIHFVKRRRHSTLVEIEKLCTCSRLRKTYATKGPETLCNEKNKILHETMKTTFLRLRCTYMYVNGSSHACTHAFICWPIIIAVYTVLRTTDKNEKLHATSKQANSKQHKRNLTTLNYMNEQPSHTENSG